MNGEEFDSLLEAAFEMNERGKFLRKQEHVTTWFSGHSGPEFHQPPLPRAPLAVDAVLVWAEVVLGLSPARRRRLRETSNVFTDLLNGITLVLGGKSLVYPQVDCGDYWSKLDSMPEESLSLIENRLREEILPPSAAIVVSPFAPSAPEAQMAGPAGQGQISRPSSAETNSHHASVPGGVEHFEHDGQTPTSVLTPAMSTQAVPEAEAMVDLPDPETRLSPSRIKAKVAFDWAMSAIKGAENMTIAELHNAIMHDPNGPTDLIPEKSETFAKYLREAGVKINEKLGKPQSRNVCRREDL